MDKEAFREVAITTTAYTAHCLELRGSCLFVGKEYFLLGRVMHDISLPDFLVGMYRHTGRIRGTLSPMAIPLTFTTSAVYETDLDILETFLNARRMAITLDDEVLYAIAKRIKRLSNPPILVAGQRISRSTSLLRYSEMDQESDGFFISLKNYFLFE